MENRNLDTLNVIRLSEKERLFKIVYFYICLGTRGYFLLVH